MYLLYQVLEGKCELKETARQDAVREIYEKTEIEAKLWRLKFIEHNAKFDCNIYIY